MPSPDSLQVTDAASAAVASAPRVTLDDIKAAIAARYDTTADKAVGARPGEHPALPLLSICILVLENGYMVVGTSAPASPDNFNAELGKNLAYENAVRQIWPLMGFALKDRLAAGAPKPAIAPAASKRADDLQKLLRPAPEARPMQGGIIPPAPPPQPPQTAEPAGEPIPAPPPPDGPGAAPEKPAA